MTVRIVDRRNDSKNKSSVNRSRFIRRFKGQIRKAVSDAINKRGLKDLDEGEKIGIPGKDIDEPQFEHGRGGVWDAAAEVVAAARARPATRAKDWTSSSSR
jgi:uncharacterized sporulation protein YeaH/YhbH (DUF444 family)